MLPSTTSAMLLQEVDTGALWDDGADKSPAFDMIACFGSETGMTISSIGLSKVGEGVLCASGALGRRLC